MNEGRQNGPQGFGRHIARADDAEQPLALPHIKYHRRYAPELQVGEQVDDPIARHYRHRRRHRMAHYYQHAQHAREGYHGQQYPNGQLLE